MKHLLLPLVAALALPTAVNAKEVINSQFPDIMSAAQTATTKAVFECKEQSNESFVEENKNIVYKELDISKEELSDPLVNLLSDKFRLSIDKECNFDMNKAREILSNVLNEYLVYVNPENNKLTEITLTEYGQVAMILAFSKCNFEKGILKNQEEYIDNIGASFSVLGLPYKFIKHQGAITAGNKLKNFLNEECKFDISEEKINENIIKYFKER
tara:strand:- start:341 stop:982 length:642 start_codon:yes stop_codon:yes gene_type:complete